jgi:alanine transaminase
VNIDPEVAAQLYKLASISLCSNVEGQIMVGLMTNPPKKGDASYELYVKERDGILNSLQRRSTKLAKAMAQVCCAVDSQRFVARVAFFVDLICWPLSLIESLGEQLPGVSCPPIDGALYLFPNITLPANAVAAAKAANKQPDVFYCLECLAQTGIVTVPGSGFGQAPYVAFSPCRCSMIMMRAHVHVDCSRRILSKSFALI